MTVSASQIPDLVMRVQNYFLERPAATLTLDDAERRFGVDEQTCGAVLTALVEANVLSRTRDGAFARFFPRLARGVTRGARSRRRRSAKLDRLFASRGLRLALIRT